MEIDREYLIYGMSEDEWALRQQRFHGRDQSVNLIGLPNPASPLLAGDEEVSFTWVHLWASTLVSELRLAYYAKYGNPDRRGTYLDRIYLEMAWVTDT